MSRTALISEYLFAAIDKKLADLKAKGVDVISFGVGDPDSPPPKALREKMAELVLEEGLHNYSPYIGTLPFREAAARYMRRRYGVTVDPKEEVLGLLGSKEGIGNCYIAYTTEGDTNLVPSLAYPIPKTMTRLMGGTPHLLPTHLGFCSAPPRLVPDPSFPGSSQDTFSHFPDGGTRTA